MKKSYRSIQPLCGWSLRTVFTNSWNNLSEIKFHLQKKKKIFLKNTPLTGWFSSLQVMQIRPWRGSNFFYLIIVTEPGTSRVYQGVSRQNLLSSFGPLIFLCDTSSNGHNRLRIDLCNMIKWSSEGTYIVGKMQIFVRAHKTYAVLILIEHPSSKIIIHLT